MPFKKKSILVLGCWRDSGRHAKKNLERMDSLEKTYPEIEFKYGFYENDSTDDTVEIVKEFLESRGEIKTEVREDNFWTIDRYLESALNYQSAMNRTLNRGGEPSDLGTGLSQKNLARLYGKAKQNFPDELAGKPFTVMQNERGILVSEPLGKPKYYGKDPNRMIMLMSYRNRLLQFVRPIKTDYVILWDTDVDFEPDLLEKMLVHGEELDDWVSLCPNVRQDIRCQMDSGKPDSYYDVWAFLDKDDLGGLYFSYNPFVCKNDRDKYTASAPIKVNSAFGGFVLVKSDSLNKVEWFSEGGCEHHPFNRCLSNYGSIYFLPDAKVWVDVTMDTVLSMMKKSGWEKRQMDLDRKLGGNGDGWAIVKLSMKETSDYQKKVLAMQPWERITFALQNGGSWDEQALEIMTGELNRRS